MTNVQGNYFDVDALTRRELVEMLTNGTVFLKHGRSGAPHPRLVFVSKDLRSLSWTEPKTREVTYVSGCARACAHACGVTVTRSRQARVDDCAVGRHGGGGRHEDAGVCADGQGCVRLCSRRARASLRPGVRVFACVADRADCCFSVETAERSLDLEAANPVIAKAWHRALKVLLRK